MPLRSLLLLLAFCTAIGFLSEVACPGEKDKQKDKKDPLSPELRKKVDELIREAHAKQRKAEIESTVAKLKDPSDNANQYRYMSALYSLKMTPEEGVPVFLALLDERSDVIKQGAIQGLNGYGGKSDVALPKIMKLFHDPQRPWYVTVEAARFLGSVEKKTPELTAEVIRRFRQPNQPSSVREAVLETLGRMGPLAKDALADVAACLDHTDPRIQLVAYKAQGHILQTAKPDREQLKMLKAIDWDVPDKGYSLFQAMRESEPPAAFLVPLLLEALDKKPPAYVGYAMVDALGHVGASDKKTAEVLVALLSAKGEVLAGVSANALQRLDVKNAALLDILTPALDHSRPEVRIAITRAIKRFGKDAHPATNAIAKALAQSDGMTPVEEIGLYLDSLRAIGPRAKEAANTLVGLLSERSAVYAGRPKIYAHHIRGYVMITLADVGPPKSALPAILDGLANRDPNDMGYVFAASARAAGAMGADAKQTIPFLIQPLQKNFKDSPLALDQFLAHAVSVKTPTSVRREAIRALARFGPLAQDAVPHLKRIVEAPPQKIGRLPSCQEEAKEALIAIQGN